jgi:hypothetical protein
LRGAPRHTRVTQVEQRSNNAPIDIERDSIRPELKPVGLREEAVPGGRGEVAFYNLAKFSQAISDFERSTSTRALLASVTMPFCSFLALAMQKHLDDLSRQACLVPEWKNLLRPRLPRPGPHPPSRRRLVRPHKRCARRDRPFQTRPRRAASARPPGPATAGPVQTRPKTPRAPQAWCHGGLNFAGTLAQSITCKIQVFKSCDGVF